MSKLLRTQLNAGGAAPELVDGQGVWFTLSDGRRVLDGSNTGGPLGHRHPRMVEAMRKAADTPVVSEGWGWVGRERAAEALLGTAFAGEEGWVGAVRFCLSGSEANDMALSLAQVLTGRQALATRERAYHGLVGLSRSMTVQPHWHGGLAVPGDRTRIPPPLAPVRVLPAADTAIYGAAPEAGGWARRLAEQPALLQDIAATIIDYTQGGIYHDPAYQDAVATETRRAGALWIADEVVTGVGRAGRWFGFQGGQSRPDIVTLGKALGGGAAPVAAVVVSKAVAAQLSGKSWQNYGTLRGHPIGMAAVSAYLRILVEDGLLAHVRALEAVLARRLLAIAQAHPSVARIAGAGLHWTVELHGPDWRDWYADTAETPLASLVASRALEAGAAIGTSGEQTSLFLAPPLIITEAELDHLLTALEEGLAVADRAMLQGAA